MPSYLLLILGWFGAAVATALLMGHFIGAGKGELGADRNLAGPAKRRGERKEKTAAAQPGKREAA
jgi:hypothetical protein